MNKLIFKNTKIETSFLLVFSLLISTPCLSLEIKKAQQITKEIDERKNFGKTFNTLFTKSEYETTEAYKKRISAFRFKNGLSIFDDKHTVINEHDRRCEDLYDADKEEIEISCKIDRTTEIHTILLNKSFQKNGTYLGETILNHKVMIQRTIGNHHAIELDFGNREYDKWRGYAIQNFRFGTTIKVKATEAKILRSQIAEAISFSFMVPVYDKTYLDQTPTVSSPYEGRIITRNLHGFFERYIIFNKITKEIYSSFIRQGNNLVPENKIQNGITH